MSPNMRVGAKSFFGISWRNSLLRQDCRTAFAGGKATKSDKMNSIAIGIAIVTGVAAVIFCVLYAVALLTKIGNRIDAAISDEWMNGLKYLFLIFVFPGGPCFGIGAALIYFSTRFDGLGGGILAAFGIAIVVLGIVLGSV